MSAYDESLDESFAVVPIEDDWDATEAPYTTPHDASLAASRLIQQGIDQFRGCNYNEAEEALSAAFAMLDRLLVATEESDRVKASALANLALVDFTRGDAKGVLRLLQGAR